MLNSVVDISLPKLGRCLRVHNAPDVVDALDQAIPGWPMTVEPARGQRLLAIFTETPRACGRARSIKPMSLNCQRALGWRAV